MPGLYVNTVTGVQEERPTTAEIVRTRFHDIASDAALLAPEQTRLVAQLDAHRRRSRELLVPLILECFDRLDTKVPQDRLLMFMDPSEPEFALRLEPSDVQEALEAMDSVEEIFGVLRSYLHQTLTHNAECFVQALMEKKDPRMLELSQQRTAFLAEFPERAARSPHIAVTELFGSGLGTANDMTWDVVRAVPVAHQRQFGSPITTEGLAAIIAQSQSIHEPLASMHQNEFATLVEYIKRGKTAPEIGSPFDERPFADPRYFWLAQKGSQRTAELTEDAFPPLLTPKFISGFTCPGKGKAIARIVERVAAVLRRHLPQHMDRINAEIAKEIQAEEEASA